MDWENLGINGDFDTNLIENHPLNVFTRLYAEDSSNKVYKECLENEIEAAIENLCENIDDQTILMLKSFLDFHSISDEELDFIDEKILKDEIKMRMYVTNKIISNVYKKRFG